MIPVQSAADVYPAIRELIVVLKQHPESELADALEHRMNRCSWTTSSELFEELHSVLLHDRSRGRYDVAVRKQIDSLIKALAEFSR